MNSKKMIPVIEFMKLITTSEEDLVKRDSSIANKVNSRLTPLPKDRQIVISSSPMGRSHLYEAFLKDNNKIEYYVPKHEEENSLTDEKLSWL